MALWLIRAGKYSEQEQRFFKDGRCYLTQWSPKPLPATEAAGSVARLGAGSELLAKFPRRARAAHP